MIELMIHERTISLHFSHKSRNGEVNVSLVCFPSTNPSLLFSSKARRIDLLQIAYNQDQLAESKSKSYLRYLMNADTRNDNDQSRSNEIEQLLPHWTH